MSGIVSRASEIIRNRERNEVISTVPMENTTSSSPDGRSRKTSLWSLVALGILFLGLTGYLALHRLNGLGASQVSAAPPPSVTPASIVPDGASVARRIQGRVLDAGTGQALRSASIWSGRREVLTDEDGRFSVDLGPG